MLRDDCGRLRRKRTQRIATAAFRWGGGAHLGEAEGARRTTEAVPAALTGPPHLQVAHEAPVTSYG